MLTRFRSENFKCLGNVTIDFDSFTVLVGSNGAGKSSALEGLRAITDLLARRNTTEKLFPTRSLTRWDTRSEQFFELDLRVPQDANGGNQLSAGLYRYSLRLSHDRGREKNRIAEESLNFEGKLLYHGWLDFSEATENEGIPSLKAEWFRDNGTKGQEAFMDWHSSGVAQVPPRSENRLLQRFRKFFERTVIVSINPASVTAEARKEESMVSFDGADFASWFLYLHHNQARSCREAEDNLREGVLPGLTLFQTESDGAIQVAKAVYIHEQGDEVKLRLDELSAGQRAMVILEHALAVTKTWRTCLIIDEPANFLALPEIQPLLLRLQNAADEGQTQAIITSHHPAAYDLLAEKYGLWLERTPLGATQVTRVAKVIEDSKDSSIPLSELVARGWVSRTEPNS